MDKVMKAEIEKIFEEFRGKSFVIQSLFGNTGDYDKTQKEYDKSIAQATSSLTSLIIKWLEGKKQAGGNGKGCKCCADWVGDCGCSNVDWTDNETRNQLITELIGEVR